MKSVLPFAFSLLLSCYSIAQQIPDTLYTFPLRQAAYQPGSGPEVFIDEAHHNMHTKSTGFIAYSRLLERDGYQVRSLTSRIDNSDKLKDCKILVIANALDSSNIGKWVLPNPSAFLKVEIDILKLCVKNGGSLLLIADHMPFAGAATKLVKAFGFEFINGFAFVNEKTWPPLVFSSEDQTLPGSPIAKGLKDYEIVDSVATFTGSAFYAPSMATPVLSFIDGITLNPDTAWTFNGKTPWEKLEGYHQGAIRKYGKGKIAVFGEAAMFTAQIVSGNMKVGFNSEYAPQNAQFTLNLIHWLDGVTEYQGPINTDPAPPDP